jgi:hypothetical protein
MTKIAILGWGSLLWDTSHREFEEQHDDWNLDGPKLKLEFSRRSASRLDALTLVIDPTHGAECQVAYAFSKRKTPEEAIADLRKREKTNAKNIGCVFVDGSRRLGRDKESVEIMFQWAKRLSLNVVLWTDLAGTFDGVAKDKFVEAAVNHMQKLSPEAKVLAAEYVWRAPDFIVTPLRRTLQAEPWFKKPQQ